MCGEGGEYETVTLNCPLYKKKIVITESEVVKHFDDPVAPVYYLKIKSAKLEDKDKDEPILEIWSNKLQNNIIKFF